MLLLIPSLPHHVPPMMLHCCRPQGNDGQLALGPGPFAVALEYATGKTAKVSITKTCNMDLAATPIMMLFICVRAHGPGSVLAKHGSCCQCKSLVSGILSLKQPTHISHLSPANQSVWHTILGRVLFQPLEVYLCYPAAGCGHTLAPMLLLVACR